MQRFLYYPHCEFFATNDFVYVGGAVALCLDKWFIGLFNN
jgi:hypothetical protein